MDVSGELVVGESEAAMVYAKARRGMSPRQMKLALVVCMLLVAIPVGRWISGSWLSAIVTAEFAVVGLVVGLVLARALAGPAMRKALAARGQGHVIDVTFRLTQDALVYDLGDVTMTARWACVTDLFRTRKHWVFLVQSSAIVLPRRFFSTPEVERTFIANAMSRMTEPARARSRDALAP
ncbi:YcxB family protein [Brevundimonas subvibrioides]|uniref:YcxB-like protein domain-containing protein n=1 Tax=Brevundimonas subvibrioides (strain ATCC 15264 / DSM 4735 / LMG 14903 / NBRC 16000 / CB 81) TaxID=633149 RepID=D9QMJ4_BRESC|nr:YcxB family protein [Brevundimonas subvibrioides]ADL00164.1 hypothetical protein Bresu_0850 [Brevundimonas subvibrioides ATCC 15264]